MKTIKPLAFLPHIAVLLLITVPARAQLSVTPPPGGGSAQYGSSLNLAPFLWGAFPSGQVEHIDHVTSLSVSRAYASAGNLGADSRAEVGLPGLPSDPAAYFAASGNLATGPSTPFQFGAVAALSWSDNVLSGPGTLGTLTPFSMNLSLSGSQTMSHSAGSSPIGEIAGLGVRLEVTYSGLASPIVREGYYVASQGISPASLPALTRNGLLASYSGSGPLHFVAGGLSAPLGTPFTVTLILGTLAMASNSGTNYQHVISEMNYYDTLSLPTSAPAFSAPGGFLVTSKSMGIVNNTFHPELVPPILRQVARTNNTISFTWTSLPGLNYQIQYNTDLSQTNWANLGSPVPATNSTATAADTIGPDLQRFYRILLAH